MGEGQSNEDVEQQVTRKVVHEIKVTQEGQDAEKLKKELELRNSQLASLALKQFEDEREALVNRLEEKFGSEKALEMKDLIVDGKSLDAIKQFLDVTEEDNQGSQGSRSKVPTGKTKGLAPTRSQGENFASSGEVVDSVYNQLEQQLYNRDYNPKEFNPELLAQLEKKRNLLLSKLIEGEKVREKITPFRVLSCPDCGKTLIGSTCPCGKSVSGFRERGVESVSVRGDKM